MSSPQPIGCSINRVEISYRGIFHAPQFGIIANASRLFDALYTRLHPLGMEAQDLKVEGTAANPTSFVVACSLPPNVDVRLRIEALDVSFTWFAQDSKFQAIINGTVDAIREVCGQGYKPLVLHQVNWIGHVTLERLKPLDFVLAFIRQMPFEESRHAGAAVAFNLGSDAGGRQAASVVVTQSATLPDALALHVSGSYQGQMGIADVEEKWTGLITTALSKLGLSLAQRQAQWQVTPGRSMY